MRARVRRSANLAGVGAGGAATGEVSGHGRRVDAPVALGIAHYAQPPVPPQSRSTGLKAHLGRESRVREER